jgi:DNA-binding LacI/PurR family transcriptional regulator
VKRATIAEIAERAGVSTGAVSYALNGRPGVSELTRKRILQVADELGWRPSVAARSLSGARASAVGLVIARSADTLGVEPFFMRFIAGLERELSEQRVALLLQVVEDHAAAIEAMRLAWAERRIDGVVVTDLWEQDSRVPVLRELRIPAVLAGRPRPELRAGAVWNDDARAVADAVDYLVALGHRAIARVSGLSTLEHAQARVAAFREAMARHGLPDPPVTDTDYTAEQGAQATRLLLSRRDRPTAILYDNDVMAVAALNVAQEMGIAVPGELSIVAGDDSQLCLLVRPALTALSWDIQAFGRDCARVLLEMVGGQPPRSLEGGTPTLTVRASTGPPPVRG